MTHKRHFSLDKVLKEYAQISKIRHGLNRTQLEAEIAIELSKAAAFEIIFKNIKKRIEQRKEESKQQLLKL